MTIAGGAYMAPPLLGGAALCDRFQPPLWLGVGGVLLGCLAWAWLVVRHVPPFRGRWP
jgi:hypothetical protein